MGAREPGQEGGVGQGLLLMWSLTQWKEAGVWGQATHTMLGLLWGLGVDNPEASENRFQA